jgi:NAD(P)-dependent dehydrogenase (short-subunit alcohol dehydrogenase family)
MYGALDYAFNKAGIEGTIGDTAYPEDIFDRTIAINLKAAWLCMKYEIPQILKAGGGPYPDYRWGLDRLLSTAK